MDLFPVVKIDVIRGSGRTPSVHEIFERWMITSAGQMAVIQDIRTRIRIANAVEAQISLLLHMNEDGDGGEIRASIASRYACLDFVLMNHHDRIVPAESIDDLVDDTISETLLSRPNEPVICEPFHDVIGNATTTAQEFKEDR